ncbi:MAG TPA: AEC family transporter [Caldimonas sp.]|jgi:malonate transporter|nr:AEC family transporter [Caldimonas sp.]
MSPDVFVKLLAIFAVVAIGWGAAKSGKLGAEEGSRVLSAAAFYVFVPALLFRTTARIDFHRLDIRVVVAFFAPTLALVTVVYTALRLRARAGAAAAEPSVRAITSSFGNAVQIGIPLAAALFGEAGLALHLTVVGLHSLTLLTVLTALVELDLARANPGLGDGRARLLRTLATTVRNTVIHPVVLPVLAGLAWNLSGLALPGLVDEILGTLGQAVVPVCLVLIGVSLAHHGLRGALRAATLLAAVKLAVHPLAVLLFARYAVGLDGVALAIVVMLAALPVGSNALIFAQRYRTLPAETSTAIVLSTLAFVVTAPLWLAILHVTG